MSSPGAFPPSLDALVKVLAEMPGYGPKSAQSAAFYLLSGEHARLKILIAALSEADRRLHRCPRCNTFCESDVCDVCADEGRDRTMLCVVESVADQLALDSSLAWPGLYFVLSGRLAPIDDVGPEEIGLPRFIERVAEGVEKDGLREVVVATSYTPEGDATAYYLIDALKKRWPELRVTRLARGLPSGLEIEYTDLSTIAGAVYSRREA